MKKIIASIIIVFLCLGCSDDDTKIKEEKKNYITVQIDYIGEGGSYTDDISGVPYGLAVGTNGPFEFDADQREYHVTYRPNSNWTNPVTLTWYAHNSYNYKIHCYVTYGNTINYGHIDVIPELN